MWKLNPGIDPIWLECSRPRSVGIPFAYSTNGHLIEGYDAYTAWELAETKIIITPSTLLMSIELEDYFPRKAKRGCNFHYVKEFDGKLYHVSRYAIRTQQPFEDTIKYLIPIQKLHGKLIYSIGRTNSGYPVIFKYRPEDIAAGLRKSLDVTDAELQELRLGDFSPEFKLHLSSNWDYILRMIYSIKSSQVVKKSSGFSFFHPGVDCFVRHGSGYGYWWCAGWPKDSSRKSSLMEQMKYIHQCWMFCSIVDWLEAKQLLTSLDVNQVSSDPSLVFVDRNDQTWSGWVEPQLILEVERVVGAHRITWKRADMMFAKGDWRGKTYQYGGMYWTIKDLTSPELIIECKHDEFWNWWKNGKLIQDQLLPYLELFKPKHSMLVSLRPIPTQYKRIIEENGWIVFDQIYPGSQHLELLRARLLELLS